MIDLDDEQRQKNQMERDGKKQQRFLDDVKWIISDARGRRFIWWLFCRCHMFESNMTGNSQTFFREGERNIGLQVLFHMNDADLNAFGRMQREMITEQRTEQKEVEKENND